MDRRLKPLFSTLERSLNDLDTEATAKLYADAFTSAGPHGVIALGKQDLIKQSEKAAQFYKRAGQEWTRLRSTKEAWYSDHYAMVTVHWASKFEAATNPVEYDVSYLVQVTDEHPKIVLFITHQDEQEAMKALGSREAISA